MAGTLLDRIVDGASEDAPVSQLLRQLKVLASRTETSVLETWVEWELGGYPDDSDLPSYRGPIAVRPLGHFVGSPMAGEVSNVEIPPSTFPAELREGSLFKRAFDEPIGTIEQWARSEFTTFGWPMDAIPMYHHMIRTGEVSRVVQDWYALTEVRYHVGQTSFLEITDAVRAKVLDLALAIERVAPLAGQRESPADQQAPAAAVINNYFNGASSVAIGGDASQLVIALPSRGDGEALIRYLAAAGMSPSMLAELEEELLADEGDAADGKQSVGGWRRTRDWLVQAGTDVGTSSLGGAIAAAAASFLG